MEMKILLNEINNRFEQTAEEISELYCKTIKIVKSEKQKEKEMKKINKAQWTYVKAINRSIYVIWESQK